MGDLGLGKDYRYAHDVADGCFAGEVFLPDELIGQQFLSCCRKRHAN